MFSPTAIPVSPSTEPSKYRAIILDYGLVLCRMPTQERIGKIADVFGVNHNHFWKFYEKNRGPYDRGEIQPSEYWSKFAQDTGRHIDEATIEQLRRWDMELWSEINLEMMAWAANLKANGYKTAILSNMHYEFAQQIRASRAWLNHFHCHIFSSEVRLIKPEPAIYQKCLEGLGVPGNEAIFVDDREVNVQAARKEGITALRFQSPRELRQDLNALGFHILPDFTQNVMDGT